ncbi:hypothetical protein F4801DRAFT_541693 [Xylaria longipes]|nr:hypothetical protein F4801DRAFT_541693 [Xylaria longipes]
MDRDWQEALFESWADSDVVLRRRNSNDTRTDSSPVKTPKHGAGDNKNEPLTAKSSKGEEGPYSETGMPTEPPSPQPQPQTPLKKRPASTRPSADIFRSPGNDDDDGDDGKSRQNRASVGDNSSIYTVDSDERRLSDKVKKAWRGVTGQRLVDPLEQWMVKHSGGTLRDAPVNRPFRESAERQ